MGSSTLDKQKLRQHYRALRRNLNATEQRCASTNLLRKLNRLAIYRQARNIALYLPNDGELNLSALLKRNTPNANKHYYLPRITAGKHMRFGRYSGPQGLRRNLYRIPEPLPRCPTINAQNLDLVLLPLVAFDHQGHRLGMGGGYYDRAFDFKRNTPHSPPTLVGIAHHCQQVSEIPSDAWDVPLDFILTDQVLIKC
ncbi:MAG: 5-formyltetrahydrofolate cyclo-ligase [Agarilytica sp.]